VFINASLLFSSYVSATVDCPAIQLRPIEEVVGTFTNGGVLFDFGHAVLPDSKYR